jgi:DNA-binding transcriptional MocR family regulator
VRLVLLVLAEHADAYGRGACPAQRTIADLSGLSRQSVADALTLLIESGLIVKRANARPKAHGTVFDLAMNLAGGPRQSESLDDGESWQGVPVTVVTDLDGDLDGENDGDPLHKPDPEPFVHPRDSYASADDEKLTVEQIRELRTAGVDEGRHQLDDERLAQRTKNSRTSVA